MPARKKAQIAVVTTSAKEPYWQGLTAIIWAIIGCLVFWLPLVNLICALAAIGFGILGLKTKQKVMSIVSIVTGTLVMFASLAVFLLYVAVAIFFQANRQEIENFGRAVENQLRQDGQNWSYRYQLDDDYLDDWDDWDDSDYVYLENQGFVPVEQVLNQMTPEQMRQMRMAPMRNQQAGQGIVNY